MQITVKKFILSIIFIYLIYTALSIGTMWDAGYHLLQGKNKLNFFLTIGQVNKEFFFDKYIPGISYTITAFIINIFPKQFEFESLHLINMLISLSAIFGLRNVTKLIFNKKISIIAFFFFIFFPAFFGHMAINPKDTIFTVSFIWVSYFVLKYLIKKNIQKNNLTYLIKISFFIALGSGVRLGFPALLLPLMIFTLLEVFYFKRFININFSKNKFLLDFFKVVLFSYLILVLFWPQTYSNILTMPLKLFMETLDIWIAGGPASMLNGEIFLTNDTPKEYFLINFLFKTPEYILLLYILSFYILIKKSDFFNKKFKNFYYKLYFILINLISVILLFSVSPYPLYDGMRLFLFIIPIYLIIPALVFYYILSNLKMFSNKLLFSTVVLLIFIFSFKFISLTPYQYVYLNYLNGKTSNNYLKFENDYSSTSIKELIKKSSFLKDQKVNLAFCGVSRGKIKRNLINNDLYNVKIVEINENYDYIILTNRVDWNSLDNMSSAKTCFQTHRGKNISEVKRAGLILSAIK